MRLILAIICAKLAKLGIKIFGKLIKANGTYFPGKIAVKICPNFIEKVNKPKKIIAVTGTNGKTTTCNLIISVLEKNGYKVLNNKYGSNIKAGVVTSFLDGVNIFNKCKYEIGVLEVDERSSHLIYPEMKPDYILVTNLFRDSLKRNAHSEFIFDFINKTIPKNTTLILNSDDLISNRLGTEENKKIYFGIEKQKGDLQESKNIINDARVCPKCYSELEYDFVRYHHIGRAHCKNCGYESPKPDYSIEKIDYKNEKITVNVKGKSEEMFLISDGIHNIYNEIATVAILSEIGLTTEQIKNAMTESKITKSRYKTEVIDGYKIVNILSKGQNPVACSIVFNYVRKEKAEGKKEVILLIEDYHDNRESSENTAWFYDCDFEFLNDDSIEKILIGGYRALDIKYRLLLAGVPEEKIVAEKEDIKLVDSLSMKKENDIYILYDMYEQPIVDAVNKAIKEKIAGGVKHD